MRDVIDTHTHVCACTQTFNWSGRGTNIRRRQRGGWSRGQSLRPIVGVSGVEEQVSFLLQHLLGACLVHLYAGRGI